jgi:hypothetical protein
MATLTRPIEPIENRLLAALPRDEYDRLLPQLQQVSFDLGEVVYEFGVMMAWSGLLSSWGAAPCPTVPSYRAPVAPSG